MDDHISACEDCRGRLEVSPALAEWAARLSEDDTAPHLTHQQLVERVENRSRDIAVEAHLKQCGMCQGELADLARFRRDLHPQRRGRWLIPAAAAAVVVLGVWFFTRPSPAPPQAHFEIPANWSAQDRAVVEEVMRQGKLPSAALSPELSSKPGTLLGPSSADSFAPLSPVGAMIYSDRPEFRWSALAGAASYRVEIYTSDFQQAGRSGAIETTHWTPEKPLERGVVYRWQIVASKGGRTITVPSPPAAEARFQILDRAAFDAIEHARAEPQGSLLAAVLFARAGLREDAIAELNRLDPEVRKLPEIQRLLKAR